MGEDTGVTRAEDGTFVKGKSGNPAGRPKGRKNQLTQLKQDLEIAVRDNISSSDVTDVLQTMVELAKEGNVGAAKIILDKAITNAKDADDVATGNAGWQFVIKNVTVQHEKEDPSIIDVTPTKDIEDE